MKKILALTTVLLLLIVSMGPGIASTHGQNETPDNVSQVTGETTPAEPSPPPPSGGGGIIIPSNEPPVAEAGSDRKVYVDITIHFNGAGSHDPDGTINAYHWFFGDGGYKSGVKVTHIYEEAGNYTTSLSVTDNNGATSTDNCTVTVQPMPVEPQAQIFEAVPANHTGYVVDALDAANTTVTVNTTDTVTVTVIKYESNPHPEDPMPAAGIPKYADIYVSDPDAVEWPIYVEMFYTDEEVEGIEEFTLGIYYWMDGAWQRCRDTGVDAERNVVWAYMTAEEASGSPILMGGMLAMPVPPLSPILSNLTITPAELELGDEVTIGLDIENIDSQSFTYIVTIRVEGIGRMGGQIEELTLFVNVELGAYESETIQHTITPDAAGEFNVTVDGMTGNFTVDFPEIILPAEFVVSDLSIIPDEVELGEDVIISFTVTNIGERTGSYLVDLKIDGATTAGRTGELEPGESESRSYELTPETLGDHSVEVNGLTDSFTVNAPPKPAEFEFSNLQIFYPGIIPPEVEKGQTVNATISIDVTNVGDEMGSCTVELVLDGAVVRSEETTPLGGGMNVTVFFEETWSAGTYQVNVEDLMETFIVSEISTIPIWMRPGTIAGIIIIILAVAAILYDKGRGNSLPTTLR